MIELLLCCAFLFACLVISIPLAVMAWCAFATPFILLSATWTSGPYWSNVRAGYKGVVECVLADLIGALFSVSC